MNFRPHFRWIVILAVASTAVSASLPPQLAQQPYAKPISESQAAVRAFLEKNDVPGVGVAVAIKGKVVWSEGFGLADRESKTAASPETRFGLGSISKSLTTALALRLAEQGKLDLDAPIERYLEGWPHVGKGVTVRFIAAHLSGLDDQFASGLMETKKAYSTTEALREIQKEPLRSTPGSEVFYGTGTYTVIAAVIEKVTGKPFETAMADEVFKPLGLKNIVPNDPHRFLERKTSFYRPDAEGKLQRVSPYDPSHKRAGAGYLATAGDLATFGSALLQDGFLKESSRTEMFRELKTNLGRATGFALGWRPVKDGKGRRIYAQPGGGPGISSVAVLYPDHDLTVVILTNRTGAPTGALAQSIADEFLSK